jgi:hypothetical protein
MNRYKSTWAPFPAVDTSRQYFGSVRDLITTADAAVATEAVILYLILPAFRMSLTEPQRIESEGVTSGLLGAMEWDHLFLSTDLDTEKRRMIKKHCNGKQDSSTFTHEPLLSAMFKPQISSLNSHFFSLGHTVCKTTFLRTFTVPLTKTGIVSHSSD